MIIVADRQKITIPMTNTCKLKFFNLFEYFSDSFLELMLIIISMIPNNSRNMFINIMFIIDYIF